MACPGPEREPIVNGGKKQTNSMTALLMSSVNIQNTVNQKLQT